VVRLVEKQIRNAIPLPKSQGTVLGLYILKMIIENGMGGRASIKNDLKGAVFTIEIPKLIS